MPSPSRLKDKIFYGWVIVATSLIIGIIIFGIRLSYGVFFKSIEGEFDLTRAATSGVFSIHMILGGVFSVLGGWALDRYGPKITAFLIGLFTGLSLLLTSQTGSLWQLFISYSLLLSIGTGATYIVLTSTAARWFEKKRGLITGIVTSAGGLGMFVMSPFAAYLISSFDWRMSYIVMGLIAWLVVLPLSMLLKKDPSQIGLLADGVAPDAGKVEIQKEESTHTAGLSLPEASKTRSFWLILSVWLLVALCYHLVLTHIVPHATDMGIPAIEAAVIISLIGGISVPGMLLVGRISDSIGRKVPSVGCAVLQAGALIWLIWSHELWMFYLFAVVFGFAFGGIAPPITALIVDTFGVKRIGIIMGVLGIGFQLGAAMGPFIGGVIFDVSNSYSVAFLVAALAILMAALVIAIVGQETVRNI